MSSPLGRQALWRSGLLREKLDQLAARADVELAVRVAEVELDRLRAEEEARADFLVRQAFGGGKGDLQLLWRQLLVRRRPSAPQALATRP